MAKHREYSTDERVNAIARRMVASGWERLRNNGHWRIRSPDGRVTVTVPRTPSDHRAGLNWISNLRRTGIDVNNLAVAV